MYESQLIWMSRANENGEDKEFAEVLRCEEIDGIEKENDGCQIRRQPRADSISVDEDDTSRLFFFVCLFVCLFVFVLLGGLRLEFDSFTHL